MPDSTLLELLYGKGAHTNSVACVQDVPLDLAGRRADSFPHSIYQLLSHMNYWMTYELRRIRRENPPYPAHASESWSTYHSPASESDWLATIANFKDLLADFASLGGSSPEVLSTEIPPASPSQEAFSGSVRAILWQIVVHNSYHLGQIAMVRRALGAWPPIGGGDTW